MFPKGITTNVYFSDWTGSVYRIPKAGGIPTALGGSASSDFLAIDDSYVYFTSYWGGPINKIAKAGGSSISLTSQLSNPWGIEVDATGVYWTDRAWQNANVGALINPFPVIISAPKSEVLYTNANATFSVAVTGKSPLHYQCQKNGANLLDGGQIAGVSSSIFAISHFQTNDMGIFTVIVTNIYGSVPSSPPTDLIVLTPFDNILGNVSFEPRVGFKMAFHGFAGSFYLLQVSSKAF